VRGRVQGVSYRASTVFAARRFGVTGWVRNVADGSVELEAQGDDAAIAALLAWCAHGPSGARVTGVVTGDLAPLADEHAFEIHGDRG
jgi:acylphosphatase